MFCEIPEFGRCCFCMPLRRGILVFGYLNLLFDILLIGIYSFSVHSSGNFFLMYHGVPARLEGELCIAIYSIDVLFNGLLIYGAHRKIMPYLRIFYYYKVATIVATVVLEIVTLIGISSYEVFEFITLFFAGLCINLYLVFLLRSLLKKIDTTGQMYENQLHQFINGEIHVDSNCVYPSTVVPNETA